MNRTERTGTRIAQRERWREWLTLAVLCLALALAYSLTARMRRLLRGEAVGWDALPAQELLHFGAWVLLYPLVILMAVRFPLGERRPTRALAHVLGAALFSPLLMTVSALMQAALLPSRRGTFADLVQKVIVPEYAWGMTAYVVMLSVAHAAEMRRRERQRAVEAAQLEAALAQARLQSLRTQLQPHFLFNALNAVASLVHKDPDAAQTMVARLGDLLRSTLDESLQQEVTLRQELELLERYLDIERVRFRDRLTIEIDVAAGLLDARVPYLILQPLVENAIRHGIAERAGPGRITVRAQAEGQTLRLEVEDNGVGGGAASPSPGVGLSNIRARLEYLYGAEGRLSVDDGEKEGLRVALQLPLRRGTPSPQDEVSPLP